ncbi:hypothetical protein [Kamptonema formosum]|uniref:hypothetical protein n=1 Tax=Kamptonema formosum TaxID=331992 RepID=UPI00034598D2|nr:hypothetical protein [Oscillatoria sp. PCC 10802]
MNCWQQLHPSAYRKFGTKSFECPKGMAASLFQMGLGRSAPDPDRNPDCSSGLFCSMARRAQNSEGGLSSRHQVKSV